MRYSSKDTDKGLWRDTVYTYTPNRLLESVTDPQGNATHYDSLDRVSMVTDAEGRRTRTFYFADGQVRKVIKAYQFTSSI